MSNARVRKIADRIQVIVAEMLERRIKDPRLGFVTVTDTRLTNDLRDATVFYTVYGTDAERADSAAALDSAKGVIRSEVGKRTGVRHTPSLTFVPDALPENARQIDDLLAKARAADEQVAKVAGVSRSTVSRVINDSPKVTPEALAAVRKAIEAETDNRIADLHVWRVGPGHLAAVVTVVTHHARTPAHYKKLLEGIPSLSHVTVEVETCCDQKPHAA